MTFNCDGCHFEIKRGDENFVIATFADGTEKAYHLKCSPAHFKMHTLNEVPKRQ